MSKTILEELKKIPAKKHMVTSISYDCKNEEKEDEVFDMVRGLVVDHLDEMAKVTYDIESGHKVKVEVIQNL